MANSGEMSALTKISDIRMLCVHIYTSEAENFHTDVIYHGESENLDYIFLRSIFMLIYAHEQLFMKIMKICIFAVFTVTLSWYR